MGAGLYWEQDAEIVYAEPFDHIDGDDEAAQDERADAMSVFMDEIFECLSPRWFEVDAWRNREAHVVARNGLFELALHEDDYGRVHIIMTARDDLNPSAEALAKSRLHGAAHGFFARMGKLYRLRQRSCAWTSRPYAAAAIAA